MDLKVIDTIGSWKRHKKTCCALIQRLIAQECCTNLWRKYDQKRSMQVVLRTIKHNEKFFAERV